MTLWTTMGMRRAGFMLMARNALVSSPARLPTPSSTRHSLTWKPSFGEGHSPVMWKPATMAGCRQFSGWTSGRRILKRKPSRTVFSRVSLMPRTACWAHELAPTGTRPGMPAGTAPTAPTLPWVPTALSPVPLAATERYCSPTLRYTDSTEPV